MPVWEVVPIVLDLGELGQAMAQMQKEECSMFGGERSSFERHRSSFERHRPCFWRHRSRIEQDSGSLPRRMVLFRPGQGISLSWMEPVYSFPGGMSRRVFRQFLQIFGEILKNS